MGQLTKEKIVKSITDKAVYGISSEFANDAVKDIEFTKCHKYSTYHYITIYEIIKKKVETLDNTNDKIAYINCLWVNYTSLSKHDVIDIILGILTGGFLGISFFDETNDMPYKILSILLIIAFTCIKTYVINTRKWDFYDKIFEHIKNDIT